MANPKKFCSGEAAGREAIHGMRWKYS
ncbi:hypothetical protein BVI2075_410006 [Burkholderia vietnamiensis]|nr:hypothetical protein BVI1335_1890006 [Burkholderia vietnamiensis]CAG9207542.1 hypothetical protein BVI2075_410006 [Burkholderia vietnamiensis]